MRGFVYACTPTVGACFIVSFFLNLIARGWWFELCIVQGWEEASTTDQRYGEE